MLKHIRNLFGSKKDVATRGFGERISLDDPNRRGALSTNTFLVPDEELGAFNVKELSSKQLRALKASDLIAAMIRQNPDIAFAVDMHVSFTNKGYTLESDDDSAVAIIEDFIDKIEEGDTTFHTRLNEMAYSIYAEGGLAIELTFNPEDEPVAIDVISPFTLRYNEEQHPVFGRYFQIGQGDKANFRVLQDRANPSETFIFEPYNKRPQKPYGASQLTPAISASLNLYRLMELIMQYIDGQAFPRLLLMMDFEELEDVLDEEEVEELREKITKEIRDMLSSADVSQAVVTSHKIEQLILGALSRSSIDGAQMITQIVERSLLRGLKVPKVLYGADRQSSTLGETEGRVEWQAWGIRLRGTQRTIQDAVSKFFTVILRRAGNTSTVRLVLDDSDQEGRRIQAECMQLEVGAYQTLVNMGAFSAEEIRRLMINTYPRFNDFDLAIPVDAMPRLPNEGVIEDE